MDPFGPRGNVEIFPQQRINGLILGSIYSLIAIVYSMFFGIISMVNFTHGGVFMLSAFIALIIFLIVTTILSISCVALAVLIVLIGTIILTSLWGWVVERTCPDGRINYTGNELKE